MATLANDQLAAACRRHPDRFSGLTAVAPQAPAAAAEEIARGHNELGFHGVIINSHTQGERSMIGPLPDAGLDSAIYGFAVETGMHRASTCGRMCG